MQPVIAPEDIRIRRHETGMTVADLASAMGVNARTIERWESGETSPNKAEQIALDVVFSEQDGAKSTPAPRRKSQKR